MPAARDEGALERVLEDRHQEALEPPDAGGRTAAQRLGGPDPTGAVRELREDRHRDDEGGADLVERRRHGGEHALGVGQRVGGAHADDDRGEPEPVVQAGQQRLARHRTEQPDPGCPVGQRDLGQVEEHVADLLAPEDEPEDHPHHHGEHRQEHVEPERPAEGVTGPTRHHHHRRRPHDEEQQQRVGGERCRRGQPDRPGPPGERVQVTRQRSRRSGHARQTPRLRRATTALPAMATTSSPSTPQVRAAGTRAGLSACGSVASEDASRL